MPNAHQSPIPLIVNGLAAARTVAAGFKVHVYFAESSVPAATFADSSLTRKNDNPMILGADGRLPADVWAPSGVMLRVVITDPKDRPVSGGSIDRLPLIDDSFSALHPRTAQEAAAGVAPANYRFPPGNVLRYGADPTGSASSYRAVRDCLKAAVTGANAAGMGDHGRVYFPRGTYLIDDDAVFNDAADFQRGFIIEGDGLASSVLVLKTAGAERWFYDNATRSTQQYIFVTVRDLQFTSDSARYGSGFRFQQDQGWRFFRCWMLNLFTAIDSEGGLTGNVGSEHKFFSCKFTGIRNAVHLFNSAQCMNIEYHGCDVESIYGDIFQVAAGGGGALRVFGGSFIMDDGGSVRHLLNIAGSGLGNNNNTFTFNGIQTEMHSQNNRLVNFGSGSGGAHIVFNECNITATNGPRRQVDVSTARVTFNRCVLTQNQGDTYQVGGPAAGGGDQYGEPGSIHFVECDVPENLSVRCATSRGAGDGLAWGLISARGCYNNAFVPSDPRTHRYAIDFDLNWYNGGRASNFPGLKTVSVKPQNRPWPFADAVYDWIVTLPVDALIANILVFRPGNDGRDEPYTLHVGNGDRSAVYGTDGGGIPAPGARSIVVQRNFAQLIAAGSTSPANQVRVWANPTTSFGGAVGGYFIVQYY
jgi:hypothetical protein